MYVKAREVVGSIFVLFFFVPHSCQIDQFTLHISLGTEQIHHLYSFTSTHEVHLPRSLLRSLLQVQLVDTSSPKSPRGGIRDTLDFSTFPYNTRSNLNSFPAFNSMESNNDTWKCNKLLLFSGGLWFSVMPQ